MKREWMNLPSMYDCSDCPDVIMASKGAALAAHGVTKNVMEWCPGSHELIVSEKTISLAMGKLCARFISGVSTATLSEEFSSLKQMVIPFLL